MDPDIPYLLLTPGPLTPSHTVRRAMQRDDCTWDVDYCEMVNEVRERLLRLATSEPGFTTVLMQGSGTFSVEATVGTALPATGKLLVVDNGAYGQRIGQIAARLRIPAVILDQAETEPADVARIAAAVAADPGITHVALVHCETTTGMLNPVAQQQAVRQTGQRVVVSEVVQFLQRPLDDLDIGKDSNVLTGLALIVVDDIDREPLQL